MAKYQQEFQEIIEELKKDILKQDFLKHVISIFLFGSVKRKKAISGRSDIDLLVVLHKDSAKTRKKIDGYFINFGIRYKQAFHLLFDDFSLKKVSSEALKDALINPDCIYLGGYFLVGAKQFNLRPFIILIFDMSELKPVKRVAISRKIYGWKEKRANKTYNYGGILKSIGGVKLGNGCIMFEESQIDVIKFFDDNKVKYSLTKMFKE